MRVSVVINTFNRGASLRRTLAALRYQTHPAFEVVVVNGPSTDDTDAVLAEFAGDVRAYRCPEAHLSKSRNVGVAHAAGDVVAFIDDDGIPEPTWLAELAAAYDAPDVGGAGGVVYDHTGAAYQYEFSACSRVAVTRFDVRPPFDPYTRPGADPFLYLQGTNCSFRRDVLAAIGGFNEEIEYYLDEVEVCMRVIDHGYAIRSLPGAAVHHKYLPSHIRDHKRVVRDPYFTVKNHCCFALRHGPQTRPLSEVVEAVGEYVKVVKAGGRANRDAGLLTDDQLAHYLLRTEQAVEAGVRLGLTRPRPFRHLPPARPDQFRPFPVAAPAGGRLKVCLVSREFPPDHGGIGRYTADLAEGLGARGHEVHVVTRSAAGGHTVDFEDGVWVHRLPDAGLTGEAVRRLTLAYNFAHAANVYREVARIHDGCGGLDVVAAPVWLCEGVVCSLDGRWPTVLTLQTTMKTIADLGGTTADPEHVRSMVALEAATIRRATALQAISDSIRLKAREQAGPHAAAEYLVPLGSRDVRDRFPRRRPAGGPVRVLFVGRLEARKGVDVLLRAAYRVLPEFPDAELVLVGKRNPAGNETALAEHERFAAAHPELASRIVFAGEAADADLMQAYADADVVVLPSRYESFGLVLTEGMMFGKPVVAARAGGMAEIVEDGGNGFLAAPGDPGSLADALRKLLASAELRAAFGRRSRELFKEKYSADAMVARTLAAYRDVIDARRGGALRPVGPGGVADRLRELVAEASGCPPEVAAAAAGELLARPRRHPVDYPARLAELWGKPDEEFVRGLYELFLNRPADAGGVAAHLAHLANGGARKILVEWLVFSEEARLKRVDASWFDGFNPPAPPAPPPAAAPPATGFRRLVRRALAVPVLGRGLRFLRQAAGLPGAVRRLEARAADLAATVEEVRKHLKAEQMVALAQVREGQRAMATELRELDEQTAARDRQLHWVLARQAEQVQRLAAAADAPRAQRPAA